MYHVAEYLVLRSEPRYTEHRHVKNPTNVRNLALQISPERDSGVDRCEYRIYRFLLYKSAYVYSH